MRRPEDQDIQPYLNPTYWDGHTLGVGETQTSGSDVWPDQRFARQAISRVRSSVVPLYTFTTGEVFDPVAYHPGTVVLFREEQLKGDPVLEDYSLEELSAQALPVRPTATSPSFGEESPAIVAKDDKRTYFSSVRWGVVPKENDGGYLFSAPASGVFISGLGARAVTPFVDISAPITVGETRHQPASMPFTPERLRRINILHLVSYGSPERRRNRIFSRLPRIAPGGAASSI